MKTGSILARRATTVRRALLMSAAATAAAVLMLQGSASAIYRANLPGTLGHAWTSTVNEDYLRACDTKTNNIGVYGRFILNTGVVVDVPDLNGDAEGCGTDDWRNTPYWTIRLQAIQRDGTASPWVNTDGPGGF